MKLRLFFDIDETLVTAHEEEISVGLRTFFLSQGGIIQVPVEDKQVPHYVFPGVLELMQLLLVDLKDAVDVSFFSAGDKYRNKVLIQLLLIQALGEERYLSLESKPQVFSRDDMRRVSEHRIAEQVERYQLPRSWAGDKKDLLEIMPYEYGLDNMLLIDNGAWNICPGQERIFLCSATATIQSYQNLVKAGAEASFSSHASYREVNSIYYVTGLLLTCIDKYQLTSLTDYLFNLQFNRVGYSPTLYASPAVQRFKPEFEEAQKIELFYVEGLRRLQMLNASLTFTHPASYTAGVGVEVAVHDDGTDVQHNLGRTQAHENLVSLTGNF